MLRSIFWHKTQIGEPLNRILLTLPKSEPTFFLVLSTQNHYILEVNSVIVYLDAFIAHVNLRLGTCNNSAHSKGQADV